MSFIETPRFPDDISHGSKGGPMFNTTVNMALSGSEQRNGNWQYPRHDYDVSYGVRHLNDLEDLAQFFYSMGGMLHGFRYKDHFDYKSCDLADDPAYTDQTLGTGDGTSQAFQIIKTYTTGSISRVRRILKPIDGTLVVGWSGSQKTEGVDYTVDYTTGLITATVPNAIDIMAGFEFDVPVRFDTDKLDTVYSNYQAGAVTVPLIELKNT